ncbi:MAG: Helix-turn-helix domain [Acidimicrobiia bacterium]|nr:Helix-turn-helix domain [Acidimicrobiia bacterium]
MKAHSGWLSVHQACRRLKITRSTLLRLIDDGELPAYRIGWMIRLLVADVEAYRRSHDDDDGPGQ